MSLIPFGFWAASGGGAAGSYDLLETTTLTVDAASVSFDNLISTYGSDYKHLQIRSIVRSDRPGSDGYLQMRFNLVASTSYAYHNLNGTGSNVSSTAQTSQDSMRIANASIPGTAATSNAFGAVVTDILDPFLASKNTTVRSLAGVASSWNYINLNSALFNSTAAVDEITIFAVGSDLVSASRFSIYGIKG